MDVYSNYSCFVRVRSGYRPEVRAASSFSRITVFARLGPIRMDEGCEWGNEIRTDSCAARNIRLRVRGRARARRPWSAWAGRRGESITCWRRAIDSLPGRFRAKSNEPRRFFGLPDGICLEFCGFLFVAGMRRRFAGCAGCVDHGVVCPAMEAAYSGSGSRPGGDGEHQTEASVVA